MCLLKNVDYKNCKLEVLTLRVVIKLVIVYVREYSITIYIKFHE